MPVNPIVAVVVFFLLILLARSLRVVKEYDRGVIFFLGKFTGVRGPGLIILIPVLEQMTRATLRTITMNIPSQKIITKDNVSIDIAAVAYYHIVDPAKSVIAIENVNAAINQISQTTVRNVVGQFSLDQLLSQTLDINAKIKDVIDGHTEPWGAQVTAVKPTGEEVAIAEVLELPPMQTTSLLKPDVVKSLPKTASLLPLVGLIGCLALGMNMVLWVMRKRSARVIVPAHRIAPGATVDR